jgi:hypothetical protein
MKLRTSPYGGDATAWPQTGATFNEARDDSEDNDSSSDLSAKQENLIKRWISSLCVTVAQAQQRICLNCVFTVVAT